MIMNPEPDKQDELQKMLALKRHEAPSPRFFKGFSTEVIGRLHSPEPPVDQTWWQRLGLDTRPVQVSVLGVVVCGLLLAGLVASLRVEPPKPSPRAPDDQTHLVVAPPPNAPAPTEGSIPSVVEAPRIGDPVVISPSVPIRALLNTPPPGAVTNRH